MVMDATATLINNTITQNRCFAADTITSGGGVHVLYSGSFTGENNIIYDNHATTNPDINGAANFTYSCSPTLQGGTGNLTSNPQFADTANDNFNLASGSPCIDTGDPSSLLDPDSTRADMGALYYDQLAAPPSLDVTLTPASLPIVIPAQGGSFDFDVSVERTIGPQAPFWGWARIKNPDGSYTEPLLGPLEIDPPVEQTLSRMRTQNIPGAWTPGTYTYLGYVDTVFAYPAVDSSSFTFTKSATGDGPMVENWLCSGEPFPGQSQTAFIPSGLNLGVSPNPFNATTAISYQLQAASLVGLKVYDTTGRLVATVVEDIQSAGTHTAIFDGSALASGLYIYCLNTGPISATGKLVLLK